MPDDMPDDPFPNVDIKVVNMDEMALVILVDRKGHLTYRSNVSHEYGVYVVDTIRARLEQKIKDEG